jgi:predicted butyrate kinase (DUF1464 family)
MVRYAGIDPGTSSYDIFVMEDDKPLKKIEIPTSLVRDDPQSFSEIFNELDADVITGLSGYGMPVKRFSELKKEDIFMMTLNTDPESTIGMRYLVEMASQLDLNIYTIPGVIHLPTVPEYRKINRIDMGTADKLCSVILGMYQLSKEVEINKQNFILVESGYGFNAFISVKNGKIVDGLGGTSSFLSFSSTGAIDGELAYILGSFPKNLLFKGGLRSYISDKGLEVEKIEDLSEEAMEWLVEYLIKGVRAVEVSNRADTVLLSGRNFYCVEFTDIFIEVAESFGYNCTFLRGFGYAKQSAEGAAIIANGISDGVFRDIIDHAEIMNAQGSVLDYITSDVRAYLKI